MELLNNIPVTEKNPEMILEFNEKQQHWHYNLNHTPQNTFGWFSVLTCTNEEGRIFANMVESINKGKITEEWILNFASEYIEFTKLYSNLISKNK